MILAPDINIQTYLLTYLTKWWVKYCTCAKQAVSAGK